MQNLNFGGTATVATPNPKQGGMASSKLVRRTMKRSKRRKGR